MASVDVERLPALERSALAQCAGTEAYDVDTMLGLLKLYQFFPEKANTDTTAKVLIKALMQLPSTDFLLCTYLVSEQVASESPIAVIVDLADLLERCSFQAFWRQLKDNAQLTEGIPGFRDAIVDCAPRPRPRGPVRSTGPRLTTATLRFLFAHAQTW